ncbi:unnamed protein product [Gongylonema pulchrum]|uniref:Uncharacterized protein n=1 Tax=Gongylonema pulchrum TaxID=637853 RepID=A0A183CVD8_9BILA|nr:unnamed protein product [Gongylonema pulchrum]
MFKERRQIALSCDTQYDGTAVSLRKTANKWRKGLIRSEAGTTHGATSTQIVLPAYRHSTIPRQCSEMLSVQSARLLSTTERITPGNGVCDGRRLDSCETEHLATKVKTK